MFVRTAQVAGATMTPSARSNPARPDVPVLRRKGRSPNRGMRAMMRARPVLAGCCVLIASLAAGYAEAWGQCTALPDLGPAGAYAVFATQQAEVLDISAGTTLVDGNV